ncbi:MFS transporter [Bifidobacterium imperatoris]|uniref:MFS transporter n=1 Tax=Bifidobacterium imperatoris TaxID=2020965 RepID=A0ABX7RZR4_9BIFI|nr:MFS transporter [Bifidobacterium imperatoris]
MNTDIHSPAHSPANVAHRSRSLWSLAAYRNWFIADTADVFAVSLRAFAIPLIGLALSSSAFISGLLVTIESAIGLVLMSIGGAIADRHDRRRLMILLGLVGVLLSLTATVLLAAGTMSTVLFALFVALFAVMNGLLGPSNDAMLKSIVPMERFAKAQAIREARESCVELSGGAISGLLYRIASWFPFLASMVLYLTAALTALALPKKTVVSAENGLSNQLTTSSPTMDSSFIAQFLEGWRWTLTRRTVLAAIVQGAVINVACYGKHHRRANHARLTRYGRCAHRLGQHSHRRCRIDWFAGCRLAGRTYSDRQAHHDHLCRVHACDGTVAVHQFIRGNRRMHDDGFPAVPRAECRRTRFHLRTHTGRYARKSVHRIRDRNRHSRSLDTCTGRLAAANNSAWFPRSHDTGRCLRRSRPTARLRHPDAEYPATGAMGANRTLMHA